MQSKIIRVIVCSVVFLFFSNCSAQKAVRLAQSGYTIQKEFIKEIPFKYVEKHIFIDVEINNQSYTFLFDTGFDFSAIDLAHIKDLKYKKSFTQKISGSSIKKRKFQFIKTSKLSIGSIDFIDTGASLMDMKYINNDYPCSDFTIAGVIGANLLRKAYWEIDYDKKVIKFSDKLENLTSISNHLELNLISKGWGLTKIDVAVNNKKDELIFDTGSSGSITFPNNSFQDFNISEYNTTIRKSYKSKKVYYNHIALVENVELNSNKFNNTYISFEKGASKLLGNRFLENYNVVIDWNNNKLFLKEVKKQTNTINKLPIHLSLVDNKILITGVQKNSIYNSDLLDKEIIRINNINLSSFSKNELCNFWKKEYPLIKNSKKVEIETSTTEIYRL